MSKSYGNAIALSMTEDETAAAIKRTTTDPDRMITFDPDSRPGVSALLTTAGLCLNENPEEIAARIGDKGSGELKRVTTDIVNGFLGPLRARRAELANKPGLSATVLKRGNIRANVIANTTLDEVREAMGTTY